MPAIVTVQEVDKAFGTRRVLAGASFAIHDKDRVGLLGVNGSGKSTLLRMIARAGTTDDPAIEPDAGLITRMKGLRLEYVEQEPTLPAGTIDAALRSAPGADHFGAALDSELRGLGAAMALPAPDRDVSELSIGERRRVALARALLGQPDLLALDEPTNHLDARTIEWLEGRLGAMPGALVLVTHDRYFLDRVATRILELDRGRVHAYEGGYTRFLEKQAERLDNESVREQKRASFVRNELDWIRRGPQARGTKQKARIERFDAAVAARPGQNDAAPGVRKVSLELPTGGRLGKTILELRGVGRSAAGRVLFDDLTLIVKPGDRIGIVGPNGAGKTTLVRTMLGQLPAERGEVIVGQNTRFAFLDQGRADLRDDRTVLQEVADGNDHVVLESGAIHVRSFLRMMLFDDGFADTPVGALSGGERNRVQLAKLLRVGGNVLVLDEPTNDLDLMTLSVLEEALMEFPGCALVVSHDRWFLDRVATGILAFEPDVAPGRVVFHEGNYSAYLARRKQEGREREAAAAASAGAVAAAPARVKTPVARKLSFKERQELEGMEATIHAAEAKVTELEAALADPTVYSKRASEVPMLVAALETARGEVDRLYARWQELDAIPR